MSASPGVGARGVRIDLDGATEGGFGGLPVFGRRGGEPERGVGDGALRLDLERSPGDVGGLGQLALARHARAESEQDLDPGVRVQLEDLPPGLDDPDIVLEHRVGGRHLGPRLEDLLVVLEAGSGERVGARDVFPLLEVPVHPGELEPHIVAVRVVLEHPEEQPPGLAPGGLGRFGVAVADRLRGVIEVILGDVERARDLAPGQRLLFLVLGEGRRGNGRQGEPDRAGEREPAEKGGATTHREEHETLRQTSRHPENARPAPDRNSLSERRREQRGAVNRRPARPGYRAYRPKRAEGASRPGCRPRYPAHGSPARRTGSRERFGPPSGGESAPHPPGRRGPHLFEDGFPCGALYPRAADRRW